MRLSIHQPAYLPWLGYLEKIAHSDMFVVLDTVAYSKNSFDNRNRICINGTDKWLTIPLATAGHFGANYNQIYPAQDKWVLSHLAQIETAYRHSPNFDKYFPGLETSYARGNFLTYPSLGNICWSMLDYFTTSFGITTKIVRARDFQFVGKGSQLILNICQQLGADEYYSGRMGRDYLDELEFARAGIKIIYQDYTPPNYYAAIHQLFTRGATL